MKAEGQDIVNVLSTQSELAPSTILVDGADSVSVARIIAILVLMIANG